MLNRATLTIGVALGAVLIAASGCSSSSDHSGQSTSAPTSTQARAAEAHNQADVTFAQHMIPHHQQAIEMSDMLLAKQGIDPRVVDMANKIKAAQQPEINQMQGWLTEWGQPTAPMMPGAAPPDQPPAQGPGDPHHGGTSAPSTSAPPSDTSGAGGMPGMNHTSGMMSEQDMAALRDAQGVDAAKLFLMQMIQHHQGAITMARTEIDTGQYPSAVAMAQSIVTSQQEEIADMENLSNTL